MRHSDITCFLLVTTNEQNLVMWRHQKTKADVYSTRYQSVLKSVKVMEDKGLSCCPGLDWEYGDTTSKGKAESWIVS